MIIFRPNDFLLKPKLTLYNNIAHSGNCKGRLLAELEIYPSPRITWEFESLGRAASWPEKDEGILANPLVGYDFRIEHPNITGYSFGTLTNKPRVNHQGIATDAIVGSPNFIGHSFSFYLPNARFQEVNLVGQGTMEGVISVTLGEDKWEDGKWNAGRIIIIPIDDYWQISLETRFESLTWLKPRNRNIGTYVTTVGRLSRQRTIVKKEKGPRHSMPLNYATDRLWTFCLMLSFANGGYIGPLYVEGYNKNRTNKYSGKFITPRITSLEQLGSTWLTLDSDLSGFLRTFTTFERMKRLTHWQEAFDLILSWYFQAIQPQNLQMGKPWPIVANAIGAALERICVLILVNDLNLHGLRNTKDRIERLLEIMGITSDKGYSDVGLIKDFIDIRNDATHPRTDTHFSDAMRNDVLDAAIQWLEEALLWRLGYDGKYRDRTKPHYASTQTRYDLTTRLASW